MFTLSIALLALALILGAFGLLTRDDELPGLVHGGGRAAGHLGPVGLAGSHESGCSCLMKSRTTEVWKLLSDDSNPGRACTARSIGWSYVLSGIRAFGTAGVLPEPGQECAMLFHRLAISVREVRSNLGPDPRDAVDDFDRAALSGA